MAASAKRSRAGNDVHQYTVSLGLTFDLDRYCRSLRCVVAAHAILRTRLAQCGDHGLTQVVIRHAQVTARHSNDLELASVLREERSVSMGLHDPLFRSALVGRTLVLTLHHAIFDQWSSMALSSDIMEVYHGHPSPSRAPFKDFVAYCNEINESDARSFWGRQYQEPVHVFLSLKPGCTPSGNRSMEKDMLLDNVSVPHLPSLIESAWVLSVASYTQTDSVLYGFVSSGRSPALKGIETTLGPTIANIPVQATLPATTGELVKQRTQARRTLNTNPAALQYGLNRIATVSDAARLAVKFQTLINIRATEVTAADSTYGHFNSLEAVPAPYALTLECGVIPQGTSVRARYDENVVEERRMHRILQQFESYLQQLGSVPASTKLADLKHLNDSDWQQILSWNSEVPEPVEQCLRDLFAIQTQQHSSAPAVDASDGRLSYSELDDLSTVLGQRLRKQHQIEGEDAVVLLFRKSMWAIVGILAVLKANATCIPIDPLHPRARKRAILAKSKAKVILTQKELLDDFANCGMTVLAVSDEIRMGSGILNGTIPGFTCPPSSVAYMIFTSGSTGEPKGVVLEHRNLSSTLCGFGKRLGLKPGYRMLHFASLVWDVSIQETIGTLIHGGCVCIPSERDRESDLANYIDASRVDGAILTPTVARTLSPGRCQV